MSTRGKIMVVLSVIMLISLITSCRKAPATVLPTNTSLPLSTRVPTNTPTALPATRTPTSTPIDLGGLITGTPASVWKEIPVMPGATAGTENNGGYIYATTAAPSAIEIFYTREMPKLGWNPNPRNGTPQPNGVLTLVFLKGQEVFLIGIIPQKVGALVMLGRQAK